MCVSGGCGDYQQWAWLSQGLLGGQVWKSVRGSVADLYLGAHGPSPCVAVSFVLPG